MSNSPEFDEIVAPIASSGYADMIALRTQTLEELEIMLTKINEILSAFTECDFIIETTAAALEKKPEDVTDSKVHQAVGTSAAASTLLIVRSILMIAMSDLDWAAFTNLSEKNTSHLLMHQLGIKNEAACASALKEQEAFIKQFGFSNFNDLTEAMICAEGVTRMKIIEQILDWGIV